VQRWLLRRACEIDDGRASALIDHSLAQAAVARAPRSQVRSCAFARRRRSARPAFPHPDTQKNVLRTAGRGQSVARRAMLRRDGSEHPMTTDAARAHDSEFFPYAASFLAGLVVCLGLTIVAGGREAVDTAEYFPVGVPLMVVAIFAIAYLFPRRPWRWTVCMAAGQISAMVLSGSSLSLWPLAIVAMLIYSIPQFVAGFVGALLARRGAGA
jgi:hypothetical protein